MFMRLLMIALVSYLGYRFFKGFWSGGPSKQEVKGKQKNRPLDLHDSDVEDAHFRDIEDEGR